jgi:parallel beta-helix repeat protein
MMFTTLYKPLRRLFTPSLRDTRANGFRPRLEALESRWVPATLLVNPTSGPYRHIQDAVTAAHAGDTILVSPGSYTESLTITKNNLHLIAQGNGHGDDDDHGHRDDDDHDHHPGSVTIFAPANISSLGAVIDVSGASGVEISGFIIDGGGRVMDAAVRVAGGGSATIHDNIIQHTLQNAAANNGLGYAIRVGNNGDVMGQLAPGTATIEDNLLQSYNKGGVIVDGTGSSAVIRHNRVTGVGLTTVLAQNGLQVSDGASGQVQGNLVTGNDFNSSDTTATGILVFNTTASIDITGNVVDRDGTGVILFQSSHTQLAGNVVARSSNDGIDLLNTSFNVVQGNDVRGSGQSSNGGDGIFLSGSQNNRIVGNEVHGSRVFGGISLDTSNANDIEDNDLENNQAYGVQLVNANNNDIEHNEVERNGTYGILLQSSNGNDIDHNDVLGNSLAGFRLEGSSGNEVAHNDLSGNGQDVISLSSSPNNDVNHNTIGGDSGRDQRGDCRDHDARSWTWDWTWMCGPG